MFSYLFIIALASLGVFLFPAEAFLSNIHEMMTDEEIFGTFGTTADSVPNYQVYSITWPTSRRKRAAPDGIKMKIELNGTKIDLNFKPSAEHLASKYTPVLLAVTDENAYKNIRYDPLPKAMTDIGEFQMYQDTENEAAIVVYDDPEHGSIIEGIVTSDFAIKSLPKRLMDVELKLGNHVVETPLLRRSVDNLNADEATSYYTVFSIVSSPKDAKRSIMTDVMATYKDRREDKKRAIPDVVYPEILLVLDHNAIRNHTITEALRFMLAFWNGVDMVYSALSKPEVRLNIAGIIIAGDDAATPYIVQDTSQEILAHSNNILTNIGTYFFEEQVRFPMTHYDMIIGMTTMKLCHDGANPCSITLGYASLKAACNDIRRMKHWNRTRSTGILHYNWNFGGVDTAVHEAAHLFGVQHDDSGRNNDCPMEEGYAMAETAQYHHQSLKWSQCSINYFRKYLSLLNNVPTSFINCREFDKSYPCSESYISKAARCLDNEPLWMKPVDEILPGRWLTLDGQCRNSGLEKGCEIPQIPICFVKGCRAENSEECVVNEWGTLPGSRCGDKMFCDSQRSCVHE